MFFQYLRHQCQRYAPACQRRYRLLQEVRCFTVGVTNAHRQATLLCQGDQFLKVLADSLGTALVIQKNCAR
ncbi:hypothetical protein GCM10007052_19580 [Halioglobus japonicus]|nr:hypothetical protein GCM10007052_19580 [Halioglobus japonicus]